MKEDEKSKLRLKKRKIFISILLGILLLSIGILIAIPILAINPIVNEHIDFDEIWSAEDLGIEAEHFFVQTEDRLNISVYEVVVENPKAVIVCLSGIRYPSATVYFGHARLFKEHDYATILFDIRAHGESDGDVICLGYKEILDTKAIVNHIKADSTYNNVPIVVFGLSMGGSTAINSIGEIPEIDGLISLSAYSSFEDVFCEMMAYQYPDFLAKMVKPFVQFYLLTKYKVNIWSIRPVEEIKKLGNRPALLMQSKADPEVQFSNFERLLENSPSHVETFVREGDVHFITENFTNPEKDPEYSKKMLDFLDRNFTAVH